MSIVRCLECEKWLDTNKEDVKAEWIYNNSAGDSFVSGYNWMCKPCYEEL
mgnify:CR=1 FL=1